MEPPHYVTVEELVRLPIRALVAFAVRCARRAESVLPDHPPKPEDWCTPAISEALRVAEDFARGLPTNLGATKQARDAAYALAKATVWPAGQWAAYAAGHAADAAHEAILGEVKSLPDSEFVRSLMRVHAVSVGKRVSAAQLAAAHYAGVDSGLNDFQKLCGLNLGAFPEMGSPVDPSESGPLGPLWPRRG